MYTDNLSVSDYVNRFYSMRINASWITIIDTKTKELLARRAADAGPWYDEKHIAVVKAMGELEKAVFSLVDFEQSNKV